MAMIGSGNDHLTVGRAGASVPRGRLLRRVPRLGLRLGARGDGGGQQQGEKRCGRMGHFFLFAELLRAAPPLA